MIRRVLTLMMLVGAAGAAHGQPVEHIGQAPLVGFGSAHRQTARSGSIDEFVAPGETVERWSRMVTVLRFTGTADRASPGGYTQASVAGLPTSCPGATVTPVEPLMVGGRPAARVSARCPSNPQTGLPETFFMLTIAGQHDMHVAQIAFRRVPTPDDLDFAARQLASVRLCTVGSRDPVCRR